MEGENEIQVYMWEKGDEIQRYVWMGKMRYKDTCRWGE